MSTYLIQHKDNIFQITKSISLILKAKNRKTHRDDTCVCLFICDIECMFSTESSIKM